MIIRNIITADTFLLVHQFNWGAYTYISGLDGRCWPEPEDFISRTG